MRVHRRWFLAIAVLLLPLFLLVVAKARGDREETTVRWDIISLQPPPPAAPRNVLPGGFASARANDGSKITLTGSGTFEPGESDNVTGGEHGRRSPRRAPRPGAAPSGSGGAKLPVAVAKTRSKLCSQRRGAGAWGGSTRALPVTGSQLCQPAPGPAWQKCGRSG